MHPDVAARASAEAVSGLASHFMLDMATYQRGAELGFAGIDFYIAGRCGVLGEVDADVVTSGLVFYNPAMVRAAWDAAAPVMPRAEASAAFIACGHRWATDHLALDGCDWARLADLAGTVVAHADVGCAPLFAAWRHAPVPRDADPRSVALHQMHVLRELRGARHGLAVLAAGIRPLQAVMVRSPHMASIFGWAGDLPDPEPVAGDWHEAEERTNVLLGADLEVLDDSARAEFVELVLAADAARA